MLVQVCAVPFYTFILNLAILRNSTISSIHSFLDAVAILCIDDSITANNDRFVSFLLMLGFYVFCLIKLGSSQYYFEWYG